MFDAKSNQHRIISGESHMVGLNTNFDCKSIEDPVRLLCCETLALRTSSQPIRSVGSNEPHLDLQNLAYRSQAPVENMKLLLGRLLYWFRFFGSSDLNSR